MATKLTLIDISSGFKGTDIETNFTSIEDEFDKVVYRDGTSPNHMTDKFDMNSNRIVNLGNAVNNSDAATLADVLGQVDEDATSKPATSITVADSAGHYTAENVEAVLAEQAGVATLSDLQSLTTSSFASGFTKYLRGRNSVGDGGEGPFRWDSSDLSTEVGNDEVTNGEGDGGIYVAPASDKTGASGAWVRLYEFIFPEYYGAKGDGSTDDSTAIQAALDFCVFEDTALYLKSKVYVASNISIDDPDVRIVGPGAEINNTSSDNPTFIFAAASPHSAPRSSLRLYRIINESTAGHIFDIRGNISNAVWDIEYVQQKNTSRKIYTSENEASEDDFQCHFSLFKSSEWRGSTDHTVNLFRAVFNSSRFSANRFQVARYQFSGDEPFFYIENKAASGWSSQNVFEGGALEVMDGGFMYMAGCRDWSFYDIKSYDNNGGSSSHAEINNHMIEVAQGAGGQGCVGIRINNFSRTQGTLATGKKDIMMSDTNSSVHITGGGGASSGAGFTIDLNGNSGCSVSFLDNATIENAHNATVAMSADNEGGFVSMGALVTPRRTAGEIISSGEITVHESYHTVNAEGGASSDDLETINIDSNVYISDGFRLVLRAASNSQTIVLKDGTGNLILNGDFSLDNRHDTIELIHDAGSWYELSRSDNAT